MVGLLNTIISSWVFWVVLGIAFSVFCVGYYKISTKAIKSLWLPVATAICGVVFVLCASIIVWYVKTEYIIEVGKEITKQQGK